MKNFFKKIALLVFLFSSASVYAVAVTPIATNINADFTYQNDEYNGFFVDIQTNWTTIYKEDWTLQDSSSVQYTANVVPIFNLLNLWDRWAYFLGFWKDTYSRWSLEYINFEQNSIEFSNSNLNYSYTGGSVLTNNVWWNKYRCKWGYYLSMIDNKLLVKPYSAYDGNTSCTSWAWSWMYYDLSWNTDHYARDYTWPEPDRVLNTYNIDWAIYIKDPWTLIYKDKSSADTIYYLWCNLSWVCENNIFTQFDLSSVWTGAYIDTFNTYSYCANHWCAGWLSYFLTDWIQGNFNFKEYTFSGGYISDTPWPFHWWKWLQYLKDIWTSWRYYTFDSALLINEWINYNVLWHITPMITFEEDVVWSNTILYFLSWSTLYKTDTSVDLWLIYNWSDGSWTINPSIWDYISGSNATWTWLIDWLTSPFNSVKNKIAEQGSWLLQIGENFYEYWSGVENSKLHIKNKQELWIQSWSIQDNLLNTMNINESKMAWTLPYVVMHVLKIIAFLLLFIIIITFILYIIYNR